MDEGGKDLHLSPVFRLPTSEMDRLAAAQAFVGENTRVPGQVRTEAGRQGSEVMPVLQAEGQIVAGIIVEKAISGKVFSQTEIGTLCESVDNKVAEAMLKAQPGNAQAEIAQKASALEIIRNKIKNFGRKGKENSEPATVGEGLKATLERYNDLYVSRVISQGIEAGDNREQLMGYLQEHFPEYGQDRATKVYEFVKQEEQQGSRTTEAKLYIKVLEKMTAGNKLKAAEITALSIVSSTANLLALQEFSVGVKANSLKDTVAGFVLGGLAVSLDTVRGVEAQKWVNEFTEGRTGIEGLRAEVLNSVFQMAPEISNINAASLVLQNPADLEAMANRFKEVAKSLPMDVIPSLVNFTTSTAYLLANSPDMAAMLPGLIYGGNLAALEVMRSKAVSGLQREARQIGADSVRQAGELQRANQGAGNLVDTEMQQKVLDQRRELSGKMIKTEGRYQLRKLSPYAILGIAQTLIMQAGGNIDVAALIPTVNAQANEANAVHNLVRSWGNIRPILAPLTDFVNEITAARERRAGKTKPDRHDITFSNVTLKDVDGKPYFKAENVKIKQGGLVWIDGEPGSGKSKFIEVLFGKKPDSGLVTVGQQTMGETDLKAYRDQIALKPQEPLTIEGRLGANIGGVEYNKKNAAEVLDEVGLASSMLGEGYLKSGDAAKSQYLEDCLDKIYLKSSFAKDSPGAELSGGQKQLLALARVEYQLRNGADIKTIVLDEPTNGLGEKDRQTALRLISKWAGDGNRTVIVVSHDPEVRALLKQKNAEKISIDKGVAIQG